MGIIARQSIKNTIYSYLGVLIGTLYVVFMVPKVFGATPEYWGVLQLIMSYVLILQSFALLGIPNTFIRFFPVFKEGKIGDFFFFGIAIAHVGFLMVSVIFLILKNSLISHDDQSNELFNKYFYYIFLILYVELFFYLFLNYARIFLRTSFPTFVKDTYIKIWTLLLIIAFWFKWISFNYLVLYYFLGYLSHTLLILGYLLKLKILKITPSLYILKSKYLKEILTYSLFSILNGGAAILIGRLDIVMIGKMIDLEHVAYYSIALLFITVLQVPVRSMSSIIQPILSDFISNNNRQLAGLYKKSAINLALTTGFIYLFIIINIDQFMIILGDKFGQIKYAVILLSTAKLFESVNSLNPGLIVLSKHYKYDIVFQVSLLFVAFLTNYFLIPLYGMEGAAMATAISIFSVGIVRALFVYLKYGLSIVSREIILVVLFFGGLVIIFNFIHFNINVYFEILINSSIIGISFLVFLFTTNMSEEINEFIVNFLSLKFLRKK